MRMAAAFSFQLIVGCVLVGVGMARGSGWLVGIGIFDVVFPVLLPLAIMFEEAHR